MLKKFRGHKTALNQSGGPAAVEYWEMLVQSGKHKVPEQRACFERMNKLLAAEEKVAMQNKLESTAVAATTMSAEGM